jgi:DNA-binding XRE family transcriptional regulator
MGGALKLDRDKLIRAREMLGYAVETTAQEAGVSKNSVLRAEHEEDIRPVTARKIAAALGVRVADLIGESETLKAEAPPLEPSLEDALAEERRLHYLNPWADYVQLLARNVEREIEQGHVTDLNWCGEFTRDVISLTHLYNRILPPPEEQTEGERLELLRLSEAIDRLHQVAEKMDQAMEPVITEMHREMYAKERERRKAAFNSIPKRGVA